MNSSISGKSKLTISVLSGFIIGIFLGEFLKLELWYLVGVLTGLAVFVLIIWREYYWRLAILGFIGIALGLVYFGYWSTKLKSSQPIYGQSIAFESRVVGYPEKGQSRNLFTVKYQDAKVQISAGKFPEINYGDKLSIAGIIEKPSEYRFFQGISGQIANPEKIEKISHGGFFFQKWIYAWRDKFETKINRIFSEPEASFAAGLVLGAKRNMPDSLLADFNRTGTTHIIAVSGYNVTILIIYIGFIFGLLNYRLKIWGSMLVILTFVLMTGAPASVVRAGILAGLIIIGKGQGRRINIFILVLLTASVMLLFNPYALRHDLSFILSFLAFLGIIYLSPVIANYKYTKKLPNWLSSVLSETLAAQIMVLPAMIYYFSRISIISPVVNVLILSFIPIAMLVIILAVAFSSVYAPIGFFFGSIAAFFLKYIIIIVEYFSKISWASVGIKTNDWWWIPIYFLFIGYLIYRSRKGTSSIYDQTLWQS